ncbi:caffeoylshikimate esterase [Nymphaea colorata]|nr:caffeoylshikimate esterase [Nymphaea colorata]
MSRICRQPDGSSPGPVSSLFLNEWRRRTRAAAALREPSVGTDSVDDELRRASLMQKDDAATRRRVREAFKDAQLSIDHCLLKTTYPGVRVEEMYETNSRGAEIFSKYWIPQLSPLKAMIFFCHGYGDTCTFFFEGAARKLASSGYGVFAVDYPGFGLSDGLHGYIPNFDILVDDVIEQFSKVKENPEYRNLPCFLLGQSMGGAVALKIHLKQPQAWNGAILIAPMCKIADDMVPHWLIKQLLIGIANFLPKQKLVPTKDLADMAFKEKKKKNLVIYNVISYKDKPRLRTAVELLRATQEIEDHLQEVSLPLLILHGEADVVTDPSVSKALYEKAVTKDKKLNLYEGAYHAILEGESDESIFHVLEDIVSWLDQHCLK